MTKTNCLLLILLTICIDSLCQSRIVNHEIGGVKLSVYLPSNYSDTSRYKILYVNDGQTIFGPNGLNMDGSAEKLISKHLIEPLLIVGIHSDMNRTSNYVPYYDESLSMDFGAYQAQAAAYSKKVVKTIIPFIEKKYKAKPARGMAGYSFGGLHATWIALTYPEQFSFSGSLSPSYWVKDFAIFKEGGKARTNQVYYFDVGTGEWNYYVPWLLHSKLPMLKNIFYYEKFGAQHTVDDWRGERINNTLLLFAGKDEFETYTWSIKEEIIKSAHTGKFYLRINPMIQYRNGLVCSISYAATFTLLSPPEDGVVNSDGSYVFKGKNPLKIKVTFRGEEKLVTIDYEAVEKVKRSL